MGKTIKRNNDLTYKFKKRKRKKNEYQPVNDKPVPKTKVLRMYNVRQY